MAPDALAVLGPVCVAVARHTVEGEGLEVDLVGLGGWDRVEGCV